MGVRSKGREDDCSTLWCTLFIGLAVGTLLVGAVFATSDLADAIIPHNQTWRVVLALLFLALVLGCLPGLVWCVAHGNCGRRHANHQTPSGASAHIAIL